MERSKIADQLKRKANAHELMGAKLFYTLLRRQSKRVAEHINKNGVDKTLQDLDTLITQKELIPVMTRYYQHVTLDSAKWQYTLLRINNPVKSIIGDIAKYVSSWTQQVSLYIFSNVGNSIKQIDETTKDQIRRILDQARKEGWSASKTARVITERTNIDRARALVIARTEGTKAASEGHRLASDAWSKETGQRQFKGWVSILDNRTRFDHMTTDGQVVQSALKFDVNGIPMTAPGDPSAPAKETVNCRCRAVYLSESMIKRFKK